LGRRKSLRENVGTLFLGWDIDCHNAFVFSNVGAEEVVFEGKVLVAGQHLGYLNKREATLIVFKDNRADETVTNGGEGELVSKFL
jgi:hypothetical protein